MSKHVRNRELLLKTADRIEQIPESYEQTTFCSPSDKAPCGTVACMAGEIVICASPTVAQGIRRLKGQIKRSARSGSYIKTGEIAAKLAGFTPAEGKALFESSVRLWPRRFAARYMRAKTQDGRAGAAAALLRYLADGGEV